MHHVSCDQYPAVGWLIKEALDINRIIHRSYLLTSDQGRINVYYHMETFILECDTNGDHNPNEYFFFKQAEKEEIYKMLEQLLRRLEVENPQQIISLTEDTLRFVSTDFSA
ncbi:hypothetical protein SRRS_36090 [Sporomusa rhizae]|uniref:hypothetical protein n=1 Tax=Sporomusa rhizae TaxID=357999 RepID=UPI00352B2130